MAVKNVIEAIRDTMYEEMARDERVILLGEDVGRHGGVFNASRAFCDAFGEERVIDTPLAESSIVGVAIGAALGGLLPIAEIQFADFIHPAVDQIISEAAKMRYRSNNDFDCPIVVRVPYGGGIHGGLYHSQCVEALFFSTPGLKIVAPSTPGRRWACCGRRSTTPTRSSSSNTKLTYWSIKGEVPEGDYVNADRQGRHQARGQRRHRRQLRHDDALRLAGGRAPRRRGDRRRSDRLCTLLPLDRETSSQSAKKTGKVLVVHEDNLTGGVGGRGGGDHRRGGLYVPGRSGHAAWRPGRSLHAVQPGLREGDAPVRGASVRGDCASWPAISCRCLNDGEAV